MNKISELKNQLLKNLPPIKLVLLLIFWGLVFSSLYLTITFLYQQRKYVRQLPKAVRLFFHPEETKLKSQNDRINFLLLGIGGENHSGADLTDTIIFASIDIKTGDLVMLAVPRDIWLEDLAVKINASYHYGEETGEGLNLTKENVSKILGQPINYAGVIDFAGFKDAIDLLGGIRIFVEQGFVDLKYPIAGKENEACGQQTDYSCRYEPLTFEQGWQTMNGERALQYVRSRNAAGEQGTDFARSQRQQQVILALKNKIFSPKMLFDLKKLPELKKIFEKHVKTDLPLDVDSLSTLSGLFFKYSLARKPVRTLTLETGTEENPGFLVNPPVSKYGQWVLVARSGSWNQVHQYIKEKIEKEY